MSRVREIERERERHDSFLVTSCTIVRYIIAIRRIAIFHIVLLYIIQLDENEKLEHSQSYQNK
jgi:hypothetical protein